MTTVNLDNLKEHVNNLKNLFDQAQNIFNTTQQIDNEKYSKCLQDSSNIIKLIDDLNPFQINRIKNEIKITYSISAEILIRTVGLHMNRNSFTDHEKGVLYTAIAHLQKILNIDPFNPQAKELFKVIFIYLTIFNSNAKENTEILKNVLNVDPSDYQLQYNLGFMYHRQNDLQNALQHFKLAVGIIDLHLQSNKWELKYDTLNGDIKKETLLNSKTVLEQFKIKCLNGLGGVYFSIQDRENALYFFLKALEVSPNDPDIHNQIGVVYTELRFTDKAIYHYNKGIENAKNAHISNDLNMLLASMNMNMGLAYCYEINYPKAIECYNQALKYKPRLSLAYQNKLLDMNYISHLIEDPMYIAKAHRDINKIYEYVENDYRKSLPNYKINQDIIQWNGQDKTQLETKQKLNIGFITGDAICHPVSYFINAILKFINYDLFNVTVYSLKVVDLTNIYPKCKFDIVKGTSPIELKTKVENDKIDILFDLASQTGDNRLDTFVLKPAPIQISYCGYPNTSGLSNMDYHIVDKFCDSDGVSPGPGGIVRPSTQKYYTEKLLFMPNCFLAYTPSIGIDNLPPLIDIQPCVTNNYLTIGTFNRYNKINDRVVDVWSKVLKRCPNVRFVIKTKEFLTPKLKQQFINTWNPEIFKRVTIVEYADTYIQHLVDYNLMDISTDTFPYSGTTTSAEALMMGTPVLTLFDSNRLLHSQNVTSSLMINSDLSEYVAFSEEEFINKVEYFSTHLSELKNLKVKVRNKFINGHVCNYHEFINDFENLLLNTYKNHPKFN
jgi:predicted O-linked N-acetylglucosamine transferase (SPINDLY family)